MCTSSADVKTASEPRCCTFSYLCALSTTTQKAFKPIPSWHAGRGCTVLFNSAAACKPVRRHAFAMGTLVKLEVDDASSNLNLRVHVYDEYCCWHVLHLITYATRQLQNLCKEDIPLQCATPGQCINTPQLFMTCRSLKPINFRSLIHCRTSPPPGRMSSTGLCTMKHLNVHVRTIGETKLLLKGISMLPKILTTCVVKFLAMIRLMAITTRHGQARPRQISQTWQQM